MPWGGGARGSGEQERALGLRLVLKEGGRRSCGERGAVAPEAQGFWFESGTGEGNVSAESVPRRVQKAGRRTREMRPGGVDEPLLGVTPKGDKPRRPEIV